ncbi:hypothetical protein C8Q76DRAFT_715149 [Earliella scabrosa]|nr:hypothetical protein C8Q76DRAFT_715149 [Earliella scabrosa]
MYALSLAVTAVLAGQVTASTHEIRTALTGLIARQDNSLFDPSLIPDECRSDCGILNSLSQCTVTDVNCACNDDTHNGLAACFNCALRIDNYNSTELSFAQAGLQSYESTCQGAGVNLNPITLSSGASATVMSAVAIVGAVGAAVAVFAL